MRKILLNPADFELFDYDITGPEFEFFQRHKDVFKQMFVDQVYYIVVEGNLTLLSTVFSHV